MKRAWIGLRELPHYRRDAFAAGAQHCGYAPVFATTQQPGDQDILVTWNRRGADHQAAIAFECAGRPVLVAENGYLGADFAGERWYALSLSHHNGAGTWHDYGAKRWDSWRVQLAPFRAGGDELVLLPQRGIGEPGVAMPPQWPQWAAARTGGRVRRHPGKLAGTDLAVDLAHAHSVYTWGSGAAVKALALGIPVYSDMPGWIAQDAAARYGQVPNRDPVARLHMFRRLAWAMWTLDEIASGRAMQALLA